ncbi:MAG TPA: hypothetical protein PK299_00180 [Anaerolineales bacterium]|nr:hypothetical protein [Anaerolineales bacterium]
MQLFFSHQWASIPWAQTADGMYAANYLNPILQHGAKLYVKNAYAQLGVAQHEQWVLPFTVSEWHPDNSYVCSPYSHYVSYAVEEFRELQNPPLEAALRLVFRPLGGYLRYSLFDHVVYVNNWLLSTNLYPDLPAHSACQLMSVLAEQFPDRAIVFRSLDAHTNALLCQALQAHGAQLTLSRSVWFQHVTHPQVQARRDFKNDLRVMRNSPYQLVRANELNLTHIPRILALYEQLYLEKYSHFNPQFTPAFVQQALEKGILQVSAFAQNGELDAVMGFFSRRGLSTAPLFGYDLSKPKQSGLYRMLTAQMSLDVLAQGGTAHFSAGVGAFKRQRGAVQAMEYNAVYTRHLPVARRRPWALLNTLVARIVEPLILRRGL